jgi:hypothetical protein
MRGRRSGAFSCRSGPASLSETVTRGRWDSGQRTHDHQRQSVATASRSLRGCGVRRAYQQRAGHCAMAHDVRSCCYDAATRAGGMPLPQACGCTGLLIVADCGVAAGSGGHRSECDRACSDRRRTTRIPLIAAAVAMAGLCSVPMARAQDPTPAYPVLPFAYLTQFDCTCGWGQARKGRRTPRSGSEGM